MLFVAGCEEYKVLFHPRSDMIILLSAPAEILIERLASRSGNSYGRSPGELRRVMDDLNVRRTTAERGRRPRVPDHDAAH